MNFASAVDSSVYLKIKSAALYYGRLTLVLVKYELNQKGRHD